jgi:hypothetical protein
MRKAEPHGLLKKTQGFGWIAALAMVTVAAADPRSAGAAEAREKSVRIEGIPHVKQKPDFCGEACAEMALRKLGHNVTQDDVFDAARLDPLLGRGCYTPELVGALAKIGFSVGAVSYRVAVSNLAAAMQAQWAAAHADLARGVPSIVCMRTSADPARATEHFRLLTGYDADADAVLYHEPAEEDGAYRRMKRAQFLDLWPLKYDARVWVVIRLRLEPGAAMEDAPPRQGFTNADYAQHVMGLKKRVPAKGFTMVLQRPFVVVGDEAPDIVRMRAESTVKWAVERLKKQYFAQDPKHIIDIWLFRDDASYRKHAWEIFQDRPDTPFGYSSTEHRALIMNIATGGGTLVHEIVHPFVDANFPACPSWLNEGLGSLYEQSSARGDRIVGLTNWRLAGLQKAIRAGGLPSFKELTGTTRGEFYSEDRGTNYAQARYLCYYLQERNLLTEFYRRFVENQAKDPTGYETLQAILGEKDMSVFQKQWEKFVLGLKFP